RAELGFDDSFCILSFGGSLGAGCINDTMAEVLQWLTSKGLQINHIHGYGGNGREMFDGLMEKEGVKRTDRMILKEYIRCFGFWKTSTGLLRNWKNAGEKSRRI
ncbi:MAG: hypothetical protein IJE83_00640, partial [Oscillospiraceae bacterium]|nr:hypothetical protein [Oscillospiraceae bacterium]